MDIRIKRAMMAAGIATAMALPLSSQASDGTITFTGAVTANTCSVSVNSGAANASGGPADATVALPTVSTASLTNAGAVTGPPATAAKTTGAGTFFSMTVSGCTATPLNDFGGGAPTTVAIYFEAGPNVDSLTGGLINATGSNVEVNLYNASAASIVGTQIMPGTSTNQPAAQPMGSAGKQWFYAGYSTAGHNAPAGAGAVSTSVTYSMVYN
jgi:major type 1 subunit fimbrin (pilin)